MVESGKTKFSDTCSSHEQINPVKPSRTARREAMVLAFDVCTPRALRGSEERAGHIGQKVSGEGKSSGSFGIGSI